MQKNTEKNIDMKTIIKRFKGGVMKKEKTLFLVLCGILILSGPFNCSEDGNKKSYLRDSGNKVKIVKMLDKQALSYHLLDEISFTAIPPDDNSIVFVTIRVSLAYPYNDHEHEHEILVKRDRIAIFIRRYISQKTYSELDKSYKRKALEKELERKINSIMEYPISHLYFSKFSVLKRPSPNS
ncbi:MAG: hypothetical protein IEMM0008_1711 [bacterium]|nr:MAG: hypothetical protein IEMM0008_1711 [bacterium]